MFRLAFERSPDAIFVTRPDGTITFVNAAFERLYGYSRDEAIGATPRLLKSGAQPPAFYRRMWSDLFAKRGVVPYEALNRTKDGRLVHVEATANPILDEHDEIIGFLAIQRDVTARKEIERALRLAREEAQASEARYRTLFDHIPVPSLVIDRTTLRYLAVNDLAVRQYGYTREEFLCMTPKDIRPPEEVARLLEVLAEERTGIIDYGVWRHRKKDGTLLDVEVTGQTVEMEGRRCLIVYALDVTSRKRLEDQLRHAQKMEAVGRLAGGVAHDFNNVLSVILSYSELLAGSLPAEDARREDVEEIRKAAARAANLTRQLLLFSRQQVVQPRNLVLNELLRDLDKLLRRLLGEDVLLLTSSTEDPGVVRVDPSSLEQVVMNLVVNARDAMPNGGTVTIETASVELDEEAARAVALPTGRYVLLTVRDSGVGMDPATQARIFEPFFTTKAVGKGTGLGLSTVHGIVQQAGGAVSVESTLGGGTAFHVYLPRVDAASGTVRRSHPAPSPPPSCGDETILLVEDDPAVRAVTGKVLRESGYHVIEERGAGEALLASEKHAGPIDLLLTDVAMPHMNGPELARRLAAARPTMKVLCMSGYTDESSVLHGVRESRIAYLQKPFAPDALASKVREVLDARSPGRPSPSMRPEP